MKSFVTTGLRTLFSLSCLVALCVTAGNAQLSISATHIPLDQLSIGDIDFQSGGNRNWFFTVNIQSPDRPRRVVLRVSARVELPDITYDNAVSFHTYAFSAPHTFTNLDLGSNAPIRIEGSIDYSSEAKQRLQNEALATGRVPAGRYVFSMAVADSADPLGPGNSANTTIEIIIRNISRLDLISPRDNDQVPNPFPLFQWIYDGNRVELSVFERLAQHQSKEEAAQGVPQLNVPLTDMRSFQYPSSAARPLQPGHRYVWRVRGFTSGSGGQGNVIDSEIWQFTVPEGGAFSPVGGGGGGQQQSLVNQLQNIPGIPPQLLSQLLGGNVQLTGVVMINGMPVSMAEILAVLNDLAQNPDKIIEVQIVDQQ